MIISILWNERIIEWNVGIYNPKQVHSFVLDKERVSQIIDNLVMNSYRFTPEGGKIKVEVLISEEKISFHIVDTGPGFKTRDFHKIFHKFY